MLFWHRVTVWFAMNPPLRFISTIFFKPVIVDFVNYKQYICVRFTVLQITLFNNFFIKNGFHSTIYTFKTYFATVFSVLIFNFSKNKLNPNTQVKHLSQHLLSQGCFFALFSWKCPLLIWYVRYNSRFSIIYFLIQV